MCDPIVYFQLGDTKHFQRITIDHKVGFCNKGKNYYVSMGKDIDFYKGELVQKGNESQQMEEDNDQENNDESPQTMKVVKNSIEFSERIDFDESIEAIKEIETQDQSALLIALETKFVIYDLQTENQIVVKFDPIKYLFTSIQWEVQNDYFHFVAITKEFSIFLIKVKHNCTNEIQMVEKSSLDQFMNGEEEAVCLNISYPSMSPNVKRGFFGRNTSNSRPFIETSISGRKPFRSVVFLDEFVPIFLSLSLVNKDLVVVCGGSSQLLFGYNATKAELLFSLQIPTMGQSVVHNVLYHIDPKNLSESYLIPFMYKNNRTHIFFYGFDKHLALVRRNDHPMENFKYVVANEHKGVSTVISVLLHHSVENITTQFMFDTNGSYFSDATTKSLLQLRQPIHICQHRKSFDTYEQYEQLFRNENGCYEPSYLSVVDAEGWKEIICTSPAFEYFSQAISLIPPIILKESIPEEYIYFYNYVVETKGFGLPRYVTPVEFVSKALQFLRKTGNLHLLIEEIESGIENKSVIPIMAEFFIVAINDIQQKVCDKISSRENIDIGFLERIEKELLLIKTILVPLLENNEFNTLILKKIDNNLYCVQYFQPIIKFYGELMKKPLIDVNGTLITPIVNFLMPYNSHPLGIDVLFLYLFNNAITPTFQMYLSYLFVIHGLVDSLSQIPQFTALIEIPDMATAFVYFDSNHISSFFDMMNANQQLRELFMRDMFKIIFNYYKEIKVIQPHQSIHLLANLITEREHLKFYYDYLISLNDFAQVINTMYDSTRTLYSNHEDFRYVIEDVYKSVIEMNKCDVFIERIYGTIYENDFLMYLFGQNNKEVIIKVFNYYIDKNDFYTSTLIYVHLYDKIWKNDLMEKNEIKAQFQAYLGKRTDNEQACICELMTNLKHLEVFSNFKPITLELAGCHKI